MSKKRIAVLTGGWSPERDVSLTSGKNVYDALQESGKFEPYLVDFTRDISKLLADLTPKPDVAFIALHGEGGEDGVVQSILDTLQIPYTHSGVLASALGMNKIHQKEFIKSLNITMPEHALTTPETVKSAPPLPFPFVIKPVSQGSSVGVYIVKNQNELDAIDFSKWSFGPMMAEEYIAGRELSASVILDQSYPVAELSPKNGFYDYTAKYTNGKTDHFLPADLPADITEQAKSTALKVHKALGCKSVSRTDFRYDASRKTPLYFLEINTHPGLTPLSILPEAALHEGIKFTQLCEKIIEDVQS